MLLEQGDQEVDGHVGVDHQLVGGHLDVSQHDGQAQHLGNRGPVSYRVCTKHCLDL